MTKQISLAEVKKHNNKNSLWIVIHNDVYDVTSYLGEHPGGEDTLLEVAGHDGTQNFEDVGHSEDARIVMKKFKIGTLPPGEQTASANINCYKVKKKGSSRPRLPKSESTEKTWRTYDGSSGSRVSPRRSHYKKPSSPKTERRLQSIVIPRERRPRGRPCERGHGERRPSSSPPRSNKLKWAIVALAGAVVIGIVLRKYMG